MNAFCEGKVAVVTGAGGTLCSAIAIDLAQKGAKVVLIGRTREKLEKVAAEISASGGVCRIEPGDVTDEKGMQEIADRVVAEWGPCRSHQRCGRKQRESDAHAAPFQRGRLRAHGGFCEGAWLLGH